MITRRLSLGETELAFQVARSRRRRTIGLKIGDEGLVVTLPSALGLHHAERAVLEKQAWVLDRLERAARRARPKLKGVDGEPVGWLGSELILTVTTHTRARTLIEQAPSRLEVCIDETLTGDMANNAVLRAVTRWRKQAALALMTPKLERYADQLQAPRPKVFVREQKARWGSCSQDGSIRMNARLIHFPEPLIDYVCAHEACHLLVMDHSARFHRLMDKIMPDNSQRRRALREAIPAGADF